MWQSLGHQQVYCSSWRIHDTIEEYAVGSFLVLLAALIHFNFSNQHSSFLLPHFNVALLFLFIFVLQAFT
jgi:hypothetical protein